MQKNGLSFGEKFYSCANLSEHLAESLQQGPWRWVGLHLDQPLVMFSYTHAFWIWLDSLNFRQLWVPAQGLGKTKSVNIPAWGAVSLASTPNSGGINSGWPPGKGELVPFKSEGPGMLALLQDGVKPTSTQVTPTYPIACIKVKRTGS